WLPLWCSISPLISRSIIGWCSAIIVGWRSVIAIGGWSRGRGRSCGVWPAIDTGVGGTVGGISCKVATAATAKPSSETSKETINTVVAQSKANLRIVLSRANIWALRSWSEIYCHCPGERDDQEQQTC